MTSNLNTSPNRPSNKDLMRDGFVDLNQLNHILRNPELPKSRLQMKNILRKYNEEKRRALTLSRIQCTLNSNLLIANCGNSSEENNSNNVTNTSTHEISVDLDPLSDFEVKFSRLPQELLINILGETFAKYENQINQRSEQKDSESVPQTNASVKQEVVSDSEDECRIIEDIEDNITSDCLKQKLNDLMSEYKSVENEEIIVSNDLEAVSQELENKLSELRECIEFCETLKQQNISINQKNDFLKNKKILLINEIKEIKEKLFHLNECEVSEENQRNVNTKTVIKENRRNVSTNDDQVIDIIDLCNDPETNDSNEINGHKNKQKANNSFAAKTKTITNPKKLKNNSIKSIKSRKSLINEKEVSIKSMENNYNAVEDMETRDELNYDDQQNVNQDKGISTEDNCRSHNTVVDWRENNINFALNVKSSQKTRVSRTTSPTTSSTSTSTVTQNQFLKPMSSTTSSTTPQNTEEIRNTSFVSTALNVNNVKKRRYDSNNRFKDSHKRHVNLSESDCSERLYDVSDPKNSSILMVTCLHTNDNQLYVGLQTGILNKYIICGDSLQLCDPLPKLDSDITALHFMNKFNLLYCGTISGWFAYLNSASNPTNYQKIVFKYKNTITCFESNATILFIGSKFGIIYRFGLMSNELVNQFKCDFWVNDLKIINDSSDRIIVCGRNEISIRNSTDGSLLQTLDKSENNYHFICAKITANYVIICSNILSDYFHRFRVYDNSFRGVIKDIKHHSVAKFVAMADNCLYVLTKESDLYCYDIEKCLFLWSVKIRYNAYNMMRMTLQNKTVIIGTRFGKVIQIIIDSNAPIVCQSHRCGHRFPRISDIIQHFEDSHAIPFFRMYPDFAKFFYCPWNGCDLRIKNNYESVRMIVEHMKTHVI